MKATGGRTNREWIRVLRSEGPETRAAHGDLTAYLRQGLRRALASRGNVDEDTVADFVQEALIRILENLDSFRGDSRFTTWAMAVAVRTAHTELRRARWRDVSLEDLNVTAPLASPDPGPEEDAGRNRVVEALYRVLEEKLTERQRTAVLAELSGMPQAVLVERLGTNRNALYKLVHDARRRLKAGLTEAGITEEEVRLAFEQ